MRQLCTALGDHNKDTLAVLVVYTHSLLLFLAEIIVHILRK